VQGISDIITIPGIINRDFADVKTTMSGMGYAVMGTAMRSGSNRANEAAHAAMSSPLLEDGAIDGARGILINISGSSSLKLSEVNEASTIIQNSAHEDANIIFGAVLDESLGDEIKITVIATGFRPDVPMRGERQKQSVAVSSSNTASASNNETATRSATPNKPRFASEIAEETAQSEAPAQSQEKARHNANESSSVSQEIDQAEDAPTATHRGSGRNSAGRDGVLAATAEMEDRQLDVPAYLRRNDLY